MPWTLDGQHAEIAFSARHMMVATVRGRFSDFDVDLHIDEEQPARSRVRARIRTASISTGVDDRDAHLRSPDFLDVEHHPEMAFESTRVTREGDHGLSLEGNLTIRGVTRAVTLRGRFAGPVTGMGGARRLGFELEGEIDREDWGLSWNMALEAGGWLVGRKVRIHVVAEVMEVASVAA